MRIIVIVMMVLSVLSTTAFSAEPEKIEKVIVTGMGVDADKARQNAIRNAVEQVVGAYVTSDTMIKDSQLIKDEILSYSGGYVKESRVISTEKNDDGLFSVKLETLVVATKLKSKIQALNIATKKVAGESLFGEAFSKIEQKNSGAELLSKILTKYPQAAYRIEVGKPAIDGTDRQSERAGVSIPLVIRWDETFLKEFKQVLSATATKEFGSVSLAVFDKKGSQSDIALENQIVCFSTHATKRSGRAEQCFALDKSLTDADSDTLASGGIKKVKKHSSNHSSNLSLLHLPPNPKSFSLFLGFKGPDGKNITTETYNFSADNDYRKRPSERKPGAITSFIKGLVGGDEEELDDAKPKKVKKAKKIKNSGTGGEYTSSDLHRMIEGGNEYSSFYPPGIIWRDARTNHLMLIEDAAFRMNISIPVEVEKLIDVTNIEVMVNAFE